MVLLSHDKVASMYSNTIAHCLEGNWTHGNASIHAFQDAAPSLVCVCVCVYAYMHVMCVYACISTHGNASIHAFQDAAPALVCMYVCVLFYAYMYVMCVYAYILI